MDARIPRGTTSTWCGMGERSDRLRRLTVPRGAIMTTVTINSGTNYRSHLWWQATGFSFNLLSEVHSELADIAEAMEDSGILWGYELVAGEWDVNGYGEASRNYDIVVTAQCGEVELREALAHLLLPGE